MKALLLCFFSNKMILSLWSCSQRIQWNRRIVSGSRHGNNLLSCWRSDRSDQCVFILWRFVASQIFHVTSNFVSSWLDFFLTETRLKRRTKNLKKRYLCLLLQKCILPTSLLIIICNWTPKYFDYLFFWRDVILGLPTKNRKLVFEIWRNGQRSIRLGS